MRWPYANLPARRRVPLWGFTVFAVLFVLFALSGFVLDGPLRGIMERKLNAALHGYTASVGKADFHPLGFGLDLEQIIVRQNAVPEPPVIGIPELEASVQWTQLLRLRLVADFELNDPVISVDRRHAEVEAKDAVPVQHRGWQDALRAIYPLKINELRVNRGKITYVDRKYTKPLQITELQIVASDIRNRPSGDRLYPSEVRAEGRVFERGHMTMSGHADFLSKPHAGVNAALTLTDIQLDYFAPVLARKNVLVRAGFLGLQGRTEYSPTIHRFALDELRVTDADVDVVSVPGTTAPEKPPAKNDKSTADIILKSNKTEVYAKRVVVTKSRVGWVNRGADPAYRVFVSGMALEVENFSNRFSRGPGDMRMRGWFMGSGAVAAAAKFRPERKGPDFDLNVRVKGTPLPKLNDLLRAHGGIDVVDGTLTLYSEVSVRNGQIRGYVKPILNDLDVYSSKQDDGFLESLYELVIGGIASILENDRGEVATMVDLSGPVDDPNTSTWQAVGNMLKNAFIEAIVPGFGRDDDD